MKILAISESKDNRQVISTIVNRANKSSVLVFESIK